MASVQSNNPIETVLADVLAEAAVLRRRGHGLQAETMEQVIALVKEAQPMPALLDWLNEEQARLWTGWGVDRLRSAFPQLEEQGLAKLGGDGRRARRFYRRIGLPARPQTSTAFEAGRRGIRRAS